MGGRPLTIAAQQLRRLGAYDASNLIPGILFPGLTLLVGKPKTGKSFLCLELALGVASGGKVLGREVAAQEVVYLALEDTQERMVRATAEDAPGVPQT